MRALHVGKYYPPFAGGIENFMGDLLPELVKNGVTVAAVVHHHDPAGPTQAEVMNGVAIHRVKTYGSLVYAPVSPEFGMVLRREIKAFKPHVIHVHMPNTSAFWLLFIPEARNIPLVIHWHADVVSSTIDIRLKAGYLFYKPFETALLKRAAAVVATSPPYASSSIPLSPFREKIRIIPLGLDPVRFAPPQADALEKAENLWPENRFRVLCIGRLTYYKGHEVLIRAASKLKGVFVHIVGKGELKNKLRQMIDRRRAGEGMCLTGFVDDDVLKGLMTTCDCLVLPSVERTEAFGLVLVEAMRFSKPVVVSDVSGAGMGYVVRNGDTGLTCPPGDASALSCAIETLSSAPETSRRMGKAGYLRFCRYFRANRIARRLEDLYGELLSISSG